MRRADKTYKKLLRRNKAKLERKQKEKAANPRTPKPSIFAVAKEARKLREQWKERGVVKYNVWDCKKCTKMHLCADVDKGTTPFMIGCTAAGCGGSATSRFYSPNAVWGAVDSFTYIWRKLDPSEYNKIAPMNVEHCEKGGLVMCELNGEPVGEWRGI